VDPRQQFGGILQEATEFFEICGGLLPVHGSVITG
jgi:hypothetical protein